MLYGHMMLPRINQPDICLRVDMVWQRTHDSSAYCHFFCELLWSFLRSMSSQPLQSRSLSEVQSHFWTISWLRSHFWRMRPTSSSSWYMRFEHAWQRCHEHRQCRQSRIIGMIWYMHNFVPSDYYWIEMLIFCLQHYHRTKQKKYLWKYFTTTTREPCEHPGPSSSLIASHYSWHFHRSCQV